jgi:hypothetical protein
MSTNVQITYRNESGNTDNPTIFVFTKNMIPTFDVLKHGVAWRVLPNIGKGSTSEFIFPIVTSVQAMWGGCNRTRSIESNIGSRYTVEEDNTGVILTPNGDSSQNNAIEIANNVHLSGGIQAQLCKDGKVIMTKNIVAYGQKATFVLHPKLYWGIASEIQEGQFISSAVLNTDQFFEQDVEGVTSVDVVLRGNASDGYQFYIENQK